MQTKNYAAQMLLVGFQRSWLMSVVFDAIGSKYENDSDVNGLHAIAPFMPCAKWQLKTPVRAYIASQWPKLSGWLIANSDKPEKLLTVIPQIERLTAKATHATRLTDDDKKEGKIIRRDARQVSGSNSIAKSIQLSTQRSAWNTCKA